MVGSQSSQMAKPAGQSWPAGKSFKTLLNRAGLSVYFIAGLCLLAAPWSDTAFDYLALDQAGLSQGEYWRIWSGQFVHTSWIHLCLNLAGLIALQQIFGEELSEYGWLYAAAIISACTGVTWYGLSISGYGEFEYIVGTSALLHGLFSYAAVLSLLNDRLLGLSVLAVIGVKIAWELFIGSTAESAELIGMPVAAETHLYGYLAGLAAAMPLTLRRRK